MAVIENSTFEANAENLVTWFGCSAVRDSGAAHGGTWSLLSTTATGGGSGVQLDNFPYYPGITVGNQYDFELWYIESTATMPTVTWNVMFYNEAGTQQGTTQTISMPRQTSWTKVTGTFTAPTGATRVGWSFTWNAGAAGPAFRVDDLLAQDAVTGPPPSLMFLGPTTASRRP